MSAADLLSWWNLLFVLPTAIGAVLGLLSAVGFGGGEEVDQEHEVDHDHDADQEHEAEHGHASAGTPTAGAEHAVETQTAAAEPGIASTTLSLLGFGRIPFGVFLMALLLFFGLFGLGTNLILQAAMPYLLPVSLLVAIAGSGLATGALARLFAKVAPKHESYAAALGSLEGCSGTVVSLLSPTEGYAQIHDRFGNMQEVRCQSTKGTPLAKDLPILVVQFQAADRLALVVENDLERRVQWAQPFGQEGSPHLQSDRHPLPSSSSPDPRRSPASPPSMTTSSSTSTGPQTNGSLPDLPLTEKVEK